MPIQALNVQRLYQQIADRMAKLIEVGEFAVGARLPPERDLARQFAVSRPTVREALIALEIAGLVEVRTGSGAYVCGPRPESGRERLRPDIQDAGPSAFQVVTARRVIEPGVAARAASEANDEDLSDLAAAVDLFERHWHGSHWEKLEADRHFHVSLAQATHNSVLVGIVEDLWKDMFGPIFAVLSERTQLTNRQEMTLHDHRTILACITRRDPIGAHAAMATHLVHVSMTLENQESRTKPPHGEPA